MLIKSFLDYLGFERNYSGKTILAYEDDLLQFQEYVIEENSVFNLRQVDSELIREWIVSLMDKGYTASSVNRKLSSLRSFYRFLLKKKEVDVDPLRKIVGPKKKKTLPVFVKEADMNKLLDEADFGSGFVAVRDRLILEMFYTTGVRLSELIGLDNSDVDFGLSVIKVTGKRNKQRLIPFDELLGGELKAYISVRNAEISEMSDAFFVKEDGGRVSGSLVYRVVKRNLSKVVALKKRSPHVLRHSFATAMLNNEAELGAVKDLLGHGSLAATQVYTHATFEELKKVYKQAHPRA